MTDIDMITDIYKSYIEINDLPRYSADHLLYTLRNDDTIEGGMLYQEHKQFLNDFIKVWDDAQNVSSWIKSNGGNKLCMIGKERD